MIPVRLSLLNFMCYRENVPVLSFTGIHTACISGDNGNGKSALIDAITWALWGKARAKSDADLIAQGQPEMSVEFDFTVSGQIYRIIRKYAKPKTRGGTGHPVLEFQVAADGGFRSISGNTLFLTEQKIREVLHMDYDTFVNSAFLRQGHADEFTDQPPAKRKEVLTNILGLSRYEKWEASAKNEMNTWENKATILRTAILGIDEELKLKPECEAEHFKTQSELVRLDILAEDREIRVNGLKKHYDSLEGKKTQSAHLEKYITEEQRTIDGWYAQINRHKSKINEYAALISRRESIEEGYNRLIAVRNSNEEFNRKLGLLLKLNEQKNLLEKAVDKAKNELVREQALKQNIISDLNRKIEKLPQYKSGLQSFETNQNNLNEMESSLETRKTACQELRTKIGKLEANTVQLKTDIDETTRKIKLLSGESGAKCPLCEQDLGLGERHKIDLKYRQEIKTKSGTLHSTQSEITGSRNTLTLLEREIAVSEANQKQERAKLQSQVGVLHKSIAEAMDAMENLSREKEIISGIERRLEQKDYAGVEQKALLEIMENIAALQYDAAKHEEIRHNLISLATNEEPKRKLEEAERLIENEKESLQRADNSSSEVKLSLHNNMLLQEQLNKELSILPQLAADLSAAQADLNKANAELRNTRDIAARIREKLERFTILETSKSEKGKLLNQSSEQARIFQELALAFGKKGIQALLIEMALPEIEIEADRLLSKMTDNRMHIKIETQRETKKGDVAETLDINVSDELGTRNYELFSGGEAFRINFAIRIALSRLLARRAGAPLPTLIIDEGFGTQDNTGIEKLKEAINSIQEDFEKILVITHIDELKDAFPSRIDVVKTADGSTITVS